MGKAVPLPVWERADVSLEWRSRSGRRRRGMELCAWNHTTAKQDTGSNLSGCGKCQDLCSGDLMTILFIIV